METPITDGKINLKGNMVFREKPKRVDYLLYHQYQQSPCGDRAKGQTIIPFLMAYSRPWSTPKCWLCPSRSAPTGDGFAEHDFLTGTEREFGLDEFPTEAELTARFKQESGLCPAQEAAINQPYYSSQSTYPPPVLSADRHQPDSGRHRPGAAAAPAGHGHRNGPRPIPLFRLSIGS